MPCPDDCISMAVIRKLPSSSTIIDFADAYDMNGKVRRALRVVWTERGLTRVAHFDARTCEYLGEAG